MLLVAALVALVAVAGAAYLVLRDTASASEDVGKSFRAIPGCTFKTFKARPAGVHIANPDVTPKQWNSFPPTSGPHYGQWVIWGDYDEPVRLTESVHNLEHGGIVIFYGKNVSQAQIEELRRFYRDDPVAMLLAPLPKLGNKIALSAWYAPVGKDGKARPEARGILAECTRFDEGAFKAFRKAYRFQGPERIPAESLQPGM
ncbi:MAG TPA: DUF3105 domain-containing protein [Gaiellaceae bacterium]|nr:DUF3105 domain-containing protein [Gaiellaceae bacterium]